MKTFNKEQIVGFVNGLSTCEYVAESVEVAELYEHVATEEGKQVVMTQEEVDVLEEALAEVEARIAFVRENTVLVSAEEVAQMVTEGVLEEGVGKAVMSSGKAGLKATAGVAGAGATAGAVAGGVAGFGAVAGGVVGGAIGAISGLVGTLSGMLITYFGAKKIKKTLADSAQVTSAIANINAQHAKIHEWTPAAQKGMKNDLMKTKDFVADLIDGEEDETIVANGKKVIAAINALYTKTESMEVMAQVDVDALIEAYAVELMAEVAQMVTEGEETKDVVQAPIEFSGSEFSAFMTRTWNGTNNDKMIEEFRSQLTAVKTVEDRAALVGRLDSIIKDANTVMADPDGFVKAINAKMFVAGNVSDDTIMSTTADQDGMTVTDLKTYVAGLQAFRDRVNGVSPLASKVGKDS